MEWSATRISKPDPPDVAEPRLPRAGWSMIEYSDNSRLYEGFTPKWHYYLRRKKRFPGENDVYEGVCHDGGNIFLDVIDRHAPFRQRPAGEACRKCLNWVSRHLADKERWLP